MPTVIVEQRDCVLHIGLNRPAKRNAFNIEMLEDLGRAYERLERDDALRVGVLFGRPWTKPVVAAVQGWCLTLGIELLLAADVRIASADARFAQLEVQRGIYPFRGATTRRPREADWRNAMRWLLTGDEFDAAGSAHDACRSPTANREGERAAEDRFVDDVVDLFNTKDGAEGMLSFMERRPARFIGA
ncbi:MAG: enoyl-CoA hydratase [Mycobacterium sp.]|nr:enoyl-CoA hydratase [Mycobacterium sp.]